jgi:hypothetical protein
MNSFGGSKGAQSTFDVMATDGLSTFGRAGSDAAGEVHIDGADEPDKTGPYGLIG